jgi:hypothetical protein
VQGLLQRPQLLASVAGLTQAVPHMIRGAAQEPSSQKPPRHAMPVRHMTPQAPQLKRSSCVLAQ